MIGRMYSLLALTCWIGGLILLTIHPISGACVAATGFVFAGKAVSRPDDMALMFGLMFILVLAVTALRALLWLWDLTPWP